MDLNYVTTTILPKINSELTRLFGHNVINYRPSDHEIRNKIEKNQNYYSELLLHFQGMGTDVLQNELVELEFVINNVLNTYTQKTKTFLLIDGTNLWYTLTLKRERGGLNLDERKAKYYLDLIFNLYTSKDIHIIIFSQKTIGINFEHLRNKENITILNKFQDATELDDIFLVYFYYFIRARQHVFIFSLDKFRWQQSSYESAERDNLLSKQEAKHFFEEMSYLNILNTVLQSILKNYDLPMYAVQRQFLKLLELHSIQIVNETMKTLHDTRRGQLTRPILKRGTEALGKNKKKQRTRTKPKPKKQRTRTKPKPKKQRTRTKHKPKKQRTRTKSKPKK